MTKTKRLFRWWAAAAVATSLCLAACGGGGGGDAGAGGGDAGSTAVPSYLGVFNVAQNSELGGTLLLSTKAPTPVSSSAATQVPAMRAQAETAATVSAYGTLVTNTGSPVQLTGTFDGSTFNVTGGGYAIVATVAGSGLNGTGTAPGGQAASVNPPPALTPEQPVPADPSGTYRGTFRIDAPYRFKNTFADGSINIDCTYSAVITGTLTLRVTNRSGGEIQAHLNADSLDTYTPLTCPWTQVDSLPSLGSGLDFIGSPTAMQFGRVLTDTNAGLTSWKGVAVRTEGFSGAISGNTIVGTIRRSYNFTTYPSSIGEVHTEGYPVSGVTVTLTKQ